MVKRKNLYQAECCDFTSEDRKEVIEHEKLHNAYDEICEADEIDIDMPDLQHIINILKAHGVVR